MTTLTVATWNIRKCVGLDRRRAPRRVLGAIAGLQADVVALQEADRRLGPRPSALPLAEIEEETGLRPVPLGTDGPSLGWHGNAILVRPDIAVSEVTPIDLPGLEPRGALAVTLETKGATLRLVAVHLGLTRRHRQRQLARLAAETEDRDATVILGDFNEWSATRGLAPLDERFAVHAPGRSYHAARPVAALDRVALGPGLALDDAGVTETAVTRVASDHLPVWARVRVAGSDQPNASGRTSRAM